MIGNLLRLPENHLQELIEDPDLLAAHLFPNQDAALPEERHLEIHGVWHILHFLLTGSEWDGEGVPAKVILGGTPVSDEDMGYRPAQYLSALEVKEVATALEAISGEQLWAAMDPESLREAKLYAVDPNACDRVKAAALSAYDRVRTFYHQAAENGHAVVKYLS